FRPPYGARDARVDTLARALGLLEVMWTVDSADSLGAGYVAIERNVIGVLRPGAIILMPENHGHTVRALLTTFSALAKRHLRAVRDGRHGERERGREGKRDENEQREQECSGLQHVVLDHGDSEVGLSLPREQDAGGVLHGVYCERDDHERREGLRQMELVDCR